MRQDIMKDILKRQKTISFVLKAIVIISAIVGTVLSYFGGRNGFMSGTKVFMFFTIQSNILIAIISAIGVCILLKGRDIHNFAKAWYVIKLVGTVSITLTGVVFVFVLAPTLGAEAWNIHNILTHVVVPLAAIVDFFVISGVTRLKKTNVLFVLIPPILYAIYAGIGFAKGLIFVEVFNLNYPYFFLNWGSPAGAWGFSKELPFMGCAWWILAIFFFLLVIGCIYLAIADRIARRSYRDDLR